MSKKVKTHSKTKEPIGVFNDTSINADQGRTVNEVERFFMAVNRMVRKELDAGKKGMIMNKGEENEIKVKYENLLRTCDRLSQYMGIKGAFSFGICKTCANFDDKCSATEVFGKCKIGGKSGLLHIYDTCDKHSKRGGGFGVG